MSLVLHHVALALAVLALGQAALRVAAIIAPSGLERLIAALSIGVAVAIAQALALGLVGLGASSVALVLAAVATWTGARAVAPAPAVSLSGELAAWWGRLDGRARIGVAALCGASGAWLVWQLRFPSIGFDSAVYHYPLVAGWIANGSPGSVLELSYDIPYGNYPLTDEVALTWGAAIARSWVPIALWNPLLLAVLAAAGWLTLRNLSVSRAAAGLATAALAATPLVVRQLNEPQTDLPALAWLACTAALATAARRRPALLVPAVLATGLAVGTKPSTGPMAVAALGVGTYLARGRLRPLAGWLALAFAGAFVVGGIWYLRNTVQHGSPVWPFASGPWGDPPPRFFALVDTTFLERPGATLDGRLGEYTARLGGAWMVIAGALVALAVGVITPRRERRRMRPLLVSGAVALVALLIWSTAWGTGLETSPELAFQGDFSLSALRYMLPGVGAAFVAVGLATRVRGPVGVGATGLLAVALVWSIVASARLRTPGTPPAGTLLLGALAGVAVLGLATLAWRRRLDGGARPAGRVPVPARGYAVLAAVALGVLLVPIADGFIERHTRATRSTAYGLKVVSWFLDQPDFEAGEGAIAIASRGVLAQLAGDRFQHRLELVPQWASCREVERLARRMRMLVTDPVFLRGHIGLESYSAARCLARHRPVFQEADVFFVYRLDERVAENR